MRLTYRVCNKADPWQSIIPPSPQECPPDFHSSVFPYCIPPRKRTPVGAATALTTCTAQLEFPVLWADDVASSNVTHTALWGLRGVGGEEGVRARSNLSPQPVICSGERGEGGRTSGIWSQPVLHGSPKDCEEAQWRSCVLRLTKKQHTHTQNYPLPSITVKEKLLTHAETHDDPSSLQSLCKSSAHF